MNRIKDYISLFFGGRVLIEGQGRTFVKAPIWLTALAAISSIRLTVITVVLLVALGMKASVVK